MIHGMTYSICNPYHFCSYFHTCGLSSTVDAHSYLINTGLQGLKTAHQQIKLAYVKILMLALTNAFINGFSSTDLIPNLN
jgi:hypothetical protein